MDGLEDAGDRLVVGGGLALTLGELLCERLVWDTELAQHTHELQLRRGDATTLDYDARGQVTAITLGAIASPTAQDQFWYDCDGQRFLKRTSWREGSTTQTGWVLYLLGGAFEQRRIVGDTTLVHSSQVQVTDTVVHRRTLAVGGAVTNSIEYRHRDHLGSVDVVTNAAGAVSTNLAFDPFGGRRAADWATDLPGSELDTLLGLPSSTQRGFTDHEHLDRTGFIHMNGRVYDPRIGRFVQSDPIVQAPFDSQSYNRYSYVFNAPLSYTDPSGFQSAADALPDTASLRMVPPFDDGSLVSWRTTWGPYEGLESDYPLAGIVVVFSTPSYAPARTEFGQGSAGSILGQGIEREPDDIDDEVRINYLWHEYVVRINSTKRGGRVTWVDITLRYESKVSAQLENWFVADVEKALTTQVVSPDGMYRIVVNVSLSNDPARARLLILPCVAGDENCRMKNGDPAAGSATRGGSFMWLSPDIMQRPGGGAHELLHNVGLGHQANSTCSIMSYCRQRALRYEDIKRVIDRYRPRR